MIILSNTLSNYQKCLQNTSNLQGFYDFNAWLVEKSWNFDTKNLLITLKAGRDLPLFLPTLLNYCHNRYKPTQVAQVAQTSKKSIRKDDLVFHDNNIWRVKVVNNATLTIVELSPTTVRLQTKNIDAVECVRIDEKDAIFQKGRVKYDFSNVKTKIESYYEAFLEWKANIMAQYAPNLSNNQATQIGKCLIITPNYRYVVNEQQNKFENIFDTLLRDKGNDIPFTCDDKRSNACKSLSPIADVCTTWDGKKLKDYTEVIIIGQDNLKKHLINLIGETDSGHIERFVLIGTDILDTNYPLLMWQWTQEEYRHWVGKQNTTGELRLKITGEQLWNEASNGVDELRKLVQSVMNWLAELHDVYYDIRLREVYYFVNEYLHYALPPAHCYLDTINTKINGYLRSDLFKNAFYAVGENELAIIERYRIELEGLFKAFHLFFKAHSPKYWHITARSKSSGNFGGGRHIIVKKEEMPIYEKEDSLHNSTINQSCIPLSDGAKNLSFEHIVNPNSSINAEDAQFLFPFILNGTQYENMLEARGEIKVYLYEGLEDFKYINVLKAYQNRFLKKIHHKDRQLFCPDCVYELPVALPNEVASQASPTDSTQQEAPNVETWWKEYESQESHQKDFFEKLYELDNENYEKETRQYEPNQNIDTSEYEVYIGSDRFVFRGYRRVILAEKGRLFGRPLGSIQAGEEIIVYRNDNKDKLYEILVAQNTNGLMRAIENASKRWHDTLQAIHSKLHQSIDNLVMTFRKNGVFCTIQTAYRYLRDRASDGYVMFPKEEKTLQVIQALAKEMSVQASLQLTDADLEEIQKRKRQYHSLTIVLGREISDAIMHYYLTGEKVETLQALDDELVEVLKTNVVQGKVTSIKKN